MNVELPNQGCNIMQSVGYIDNYRNNVRTRYYIDNNRLVQVSTNSYTTQPTGYSCLTTGAITYKPEISVYFQVIAVIACIAIFIGILKATRLLK